MQVFKVQLAKEAFKFSASHFTILSPTEAERLHGHNYYVTVECTVTSLGALGMAFEFNTLKPFVKALTEIWDERVLIPTKSLHLILRDEMVGEEPHLTIGFQRRSYRFPKSEIALLETENITSEELARLFAMKLTQDWMKSTGAGGDPSLAARVQNLTVKIEETRGQSASFSIESPLRRSESM